METVLGKGTGIVCTACADLAAKPQGAWGATVSLKRVQIRMTSDGENRHNMAMASLNISMPEGLRSFVEQRARETNHATPTEYVRSLLREDKKRAEQEQIERQLLAGLRSGEAVDIGDLTDYFAEKRKRLLQKGVSTTAKPAQTKASRR
jgi:antitoxin ParD1/3/4